MRNIRDGDRRNEVGRVIERLCRNTGSNKAECRGFSARSAVIPDVTTLLRVPVDSPGTRLRSARPRRAVNCEIFASTGAMHHRINTPVVKLRTRLSQRLKPATAATAPPASPSTTTGTRERSEHETFSRFANRR